MRQLLEAGVHFGHQTHRWNPRMQQYLYGSRNKIHIIDVKATIKGLLLGRKFISKVVANGQDVLFVGTKRQAKLIIEQHVKPTGMPYVTERWLGGTLTNFRTIRERLKRLVELEELDKTGEIAHYSKKMESQLTREKKKILRNLEGIRNMSRLPDALFVVDTRKEKIAVDEARKLKIPVIGVVDTNCDPDEVDFVIPGNDDALRAIRLFASRIADAVLGGRGIRESVQADDETDADDRGRRGSRPGGAVRPARPEQATSTATV